MRLRIVSGRSPGTEQAVGNPGSQDTLPLRAGRGASLGRRASVPLLPRVSAALAQFISPIANSDRRPAASGSSFERFGGDSQQQKQSRPQPDEAKVIPIRPAEAAAPLNGPTPATAPAATAPPAGPNGIAQAFMQLIGLFQLRKGRLLTRFGERAYASAESGQRKGAKFRKGAMLDRKIE